MEGGIVVNEDTTIAIPAFNEEPFIAEAIESALAQDARVLICDNHSMDGTREICESFARRHPRITYVRHQDNLGSAANFKYGMEHARSEFFMWLGAHDILPSGYVSALRSALQRRPDAVLAFGDVRYVDRQSRHVRNYAYEFGAELGAPTSLRRLLAIAHHLNDCSLVHGLFRLQALRRSWLDEVCLGIDHVLIARTAVQGPLEHVPGVSYGRRLVHAEYSAEKQMERLKPEAEIDPTVHRYGRMIRLQLGLIDSLPDASWIGAKAGKWRAGYYFMRRFGPWAEPGSTTRLLQEGFRLVGRVLRGVGLRRGGWSG